MTPVAEVGGQHTDDLVGLAVDTNPPANNVAVSAEMKFPVAVADDEDAVVAVVCNVEVACGIDKQAVGRVQTGAGCRAIIAAEGGVRSCPAFAGCYNEDLGTICYFNAGHTPGLLRDLTGITELPATGLPLGLFSHATCEAPLVALPPGAALLLVSRGLLEGKRRRSEVKRTRRGGDE